MCIECGCEVAEEPEAKDDEDRSEAEEQPEVD
jgi:hypothetical protein